MTPLYVAVCVSNTIQDYNKVESMISNALQRVVVPQHQYIVFITRAGTSTDSKYPEWYANKHGYQCEVFKPDSNSYGGGLSLVKRDEDIVKKCYVAILIDDKTSFSISNMARKVDSLHKILYYTQIK